MPHQQQRLNEPAGPATHGLIQQPNSRAAHLETRTIDLRDAKAPGPLISPSQAPCVFPPSSSRARGGGCGGPCSGKATQGPRPPKATSGPWAALVGPQGVFVAHFRRATFIFFGPGVLAGSRRRSEGGSCGAGGWQKKNNPPAALSPPPPSTRPSQPPTRHRPHTHLYGPRAMKMHGARISGAKLHGA
jgi:hypothetical protein